MAGNIEYCDKDHIYWQRLFQVGTQPKNCVVLVQILFNMSGIMFAHSCEGEAVTCFYPRDTDLQKSFKKVLKNKLVTNWLCSVLSD